MPSKKVPLESGEKYHVFNRGVDKRVVFHDLEDYLRFYESLYYFNTVEPVSDLRRAKSRGSQSEGKLVEILAYALLDNHFHLILEQLSEQGVSEFMKRIGTGYTSFYNEKYERSGVLFQGKFKRVHISNDAQMNYLFAYVNENHTVHGVEQPQHICQSSALHFAAKYTSKLLPPNSDSYNQADARQLAQGIYKDRQNRNRELFE